MSDNNYSVDDILAEIEKKHKTHSDSHEEKSSISVTEIIGGNELEEAIAASHHGKKSSEEIERREREEQSRRAGELRESAIEAGFDSGEGMKPKAKKQRPEKPLREKAKPIVREHKEAEERKKPIKEEKIVESIPKKAPVISEEEKPAKVRPVEEKPAHSGFTAELSSPEEASKIFGSDTAEVRTVKPESEFVKPFVKPKVAGADDDIVFHTQSALVNSATQQMKKQQRIEEISRALLNKDREAESPEELMDSLNPMDSLAKAAEDVKKSEEEQLKQASGNTLAVAGNDFKRLSAVPAEDGVREYSPVTSRKKSKTDVPLVTLGGETAGGDALGSDALVASLNKKLKEQHEKELEAERTVTLTDLDRAQKLPPHALNIDYEKQLIDTSLLPKSNPVSEIQKAEELSERKKRKIKDFVIADIEEEANTAVPDNEPDEDEDEEDEDEPIDLDDENVISERLTRAGKGLVSRLTILSLMTAAAIFVGIINQFNLNIPFISELVNRRMNPEGHLYTYLVLAILSFSACSSVVTNGFSRLFKGKPDGDTLCALAHIGSMGALVLYLAKPEYIQRGYSHIYLAVSLAALCFNTVAKLFTVRAAQNNFRFISADRSKYFAECGADDGAHKLAEKVSGIPVIASMHKTEMLCDFIISTYCEDASDRISRIMTPIVFGLAVVCGGMGFFMNESSAVLNDWSWAVTLATAVLCVGATFSGAMIVMLPMLSASKRLTAKNAAVLGCAAAEDFSEVNAVLVEAKTLFPTGTVRIKNIWDYNKDGKRGTQHIMIDEAIIYAASLAVSSDSILADALFNMLNYKAALLKKVSSCVYESDKGVMGWIGSRRVLLGNRDHMKSHGITVPDSKKEAALNKDKCEVVYLAVGGELCMLFFVATNANHQVKHYVNQLVRKGVTLEVKTVDGLVTQAVIAELFDIDADYVSIVSSEAHETFDERTKFVPKGSAAVSCDGTFGSFAAAVVGAKNLREKISMGCVMQIGGVALGIMLAFIFGFFQNHDAFNVFFLLFYNLIWMIVTILVQSIKRII